MTAEDRSFPPLLAALYALHHQLLVEADERANSDDYDEDDEENEDDAIDLEAYSEFDSATRTRSWIAAWTGDRTQTGAEFRIFGQDGTGGRVAIWNIRPDADLLAQPIVFLGSEGERGVVAADLADYLWLLAGGFGPYEAVASPNSRPEPNPAFTEFATTHAADRRKSPQQVRERTRREWQTQFESHVRAICR